MLNGEFNNTLDAKGRLIVPSKVKEALGNEFVITRGLEKCLLVYPMESWQVMEETRKGLDFFNPTARKFVRFFFGSAVTCEVDNQGRALIPLQLRSWAGIDREVVTVGAGDKLEIWDKQTYDAFVEEEFDPVKLSEDFSSLGVGNKL